MRYLALALLAICLRKEFGMTLLLTTHYMEEAEELCDRIAIMNQGPHRGDGNTRGITPEGPKPRATMDDLFVHFVGRSNPTIKEAWPMSNEAARTAQRLG